jgi:transporter family-2 protein
VNIRLGKVAGSPLWGTVANFTVGLAGILALLVARREAPPRLADLAASPWWSWTGGLMGVSIVCGAIMLTPAIGTLLFSVGTLAGQLVASVVIDHYGLFGLPHHGASLGRIGGLALVALGIVLIRVY